MKTTDMNYTPIQLKLPVDMERIIEINDSVYTFNEVVSHIDLKKYFVEKDYKATGRPRYEREKLLKVLLFAFMEHGYQEYEWLDQKLASIFSLEAARKAARQMRKPNDFCNLFVQSLCLTAQLGFAIQRYQQALIPLVESLDDTELTRDAEG
ncbi:MAG: hypothetical protein Q4G00_04325 [Clostridia bacterium]|nr:hypothetical protein [Clostridia bacterium]